ncbi:hypothetical protein Q7P37_002338 [Cladosporium fusiforme]
MAPWTLHERFTLFHLFRTYGYQRNDDDWWSIFKSMHGTGRERQVVYDDWGQAENGTRGAMYRNQILNSSRYTAEETATSEHTLRRIYRHATRLTITLPRKIERKARKPEQPVKRKNGDASAPTPSTAENTQDQTAPTSAKAIPPIARREKPTGTPKPDHEEVMSSTANRPTQIAPLPPVHNVGPFIKREKPTGPLKRKREQAAPSTGYQINDFDKSVQAAERLMATANHFRYVMATDKRPEDVETGTTKASKDLAQSSPLSRAEPNTRSQKGETGSIEGQGSQNGKRKSRDELNVNYAQRFDANGRMPEAPERSRARSKPSLEKQKSSSAIPGDDEMKADDRNDVELEKPCENNISGIESAGQQHSEPDIPRFLEWIPKDGLNSSDNTANTQLSVYTEIKESDAKAYICWVLESLLHILEDPIVQKPKTNLPPWQKPPPFGPAPTSKERIKTYVANVFGNHVNSEAFERIYDENVASGGRLGSIAYGVHFACEKLAEHSRPFWESFEAGYPEYTEQEGIFSNFRLAASLFGQRMSMFHYNDVKWVGEQGGQPVIGLAGTLPVDQLKLVSRKSPAFKRGGRVYSIMFFQPNCLGMGINVKESTALIMIDAMICDRNHCDKCSPGVLDIPKEASQFSGLPRVHARFLKNDNVFVHANILSPEDHDEEFVEDTELGPIEVTFFHGAWQEAIICDRSSCDGCQEYTDFYKKLEYPDFSKVENQGVDLGKTGKKGRGRKGRR